MQCQRHQLPENIPIFKQIERAGIIAIWFERTRITLSVTLRLSSDVVLNSAVQN